MKGRAWNQVATEAAVVRFNCRVGEIDPVCLREQVDEIPESCLREHASVCLRFVFQSISMRSQRQVFVLKIHSESLY